MGQKEAHMRTVWWEDGVVKMIDQRLLPHQFEIVAFDNEHDVARAIREMYIRGAPAIGAAAGFGMALAAQRSQAATTEDLLNDLRTAYDVLYASRPTAVNLRWALDRMMALATSLREQPHQVVRDALVAEAQRIADEDIETNQRMARYGAELVPEGANILHHCNTGGLATVDWGTALGVIRMAHEQGKNIHVWVDETRPRLQGARLTAWELMQWGVPMTLIADNAAGYLMWSGQVDLVTVGADRIAANGDVANKIGTYKLAVVAKENNIPFYVVAPTSTIDLQTPTGRDIPIEERDPREVTHVLGQCNIAPEGVNAYNPAFDITPHELVTAIITEYGVVRPPYEENLRRVVEQAEADRKARQASGSV
ncbi:methylthioribose-1-phosphate isomerase [Ardenticatena maritima]|uniref:Methylthioribose-1-phosphate isomerase n=2 Tax=Ardenticatena maritima TaxID=872965 RepID=A0A0M9UBD5_9CHLR|nr:methylthioribose-1-phosphate isomerase [Ardenticatena maritima]